MAGSPSSTSLANKEVQYSDGAGLIRQIQVFPKNNSNLMRHASDHLGSPERPRLRKSPDIMCSLQSTDANPDINPDNSTLVPTEITFNMHLRVDDSEKPQAIWRVPWEHLRNWDLLQERAKRYIYENGHPEYETSENKWRRLILRNGHFIISVDGYGTEPQNLWQQTQLSGLLWRNLCHCVGFYPTLPLEVDLHWDYSSLNISPEGAGAYPDVLRYALWQKMRTNFAKREYYPRSEVDQIFSHAVISHLIRKEPSNLTETAREDLENLILERKNGRRLLALCISKKYR